MHQPHTPSPDDETPHLLGGLAAAVEHDTQMSAEDVTGLLQLARRTNNVRLHIHCLRHPNLPESARTADAHHPDPHIRRAWLQSTTSLTAADLRQLAEAPNHLSLRLPQIEAVAGNPHLAGEQLDVLTDLLPAVLSRNPSRYCTVHRKLLQHPNATLRQLQRWLNDQPNHEAIHDVLQQRPDLAGTLLQSYETTWVPTNHLVNTTNDMVGLADAISRMQQTGDLRASTLQAAANNSTLDLPTARVLLHAAEQLHTTNMMSGQRLRQLHDALSRFGQLPVDGPAARLRQADHLPPNDLTDLTDRIRVACDRKAAQQVMARDDVPAAVVLQLAPLVPASMVADHLQRHPDVVELHAVVWYGGQYPQHLLNELNPNLRRQVLQAIVNHPDTPQPASTDMLLNCHLIKDEELLDVVALRNLAQAAAADIRGSHRAQQLLCQAVAGTDPDVLHTMAVMAQDMPAVAATIRTAATNALTAASRPPGSHHVA